MNTKKISFKAVTFDLWETLLLERSGDNSRRMFTRCRNLSKTYNKFGVKISVKDMKSVLKALTPWLVTIWKTNKDVTHMDQIKFIAKTASKGLIPIKEEWFDDLSAAYVSPLFEVPPYLNPDAHRVLKWLKHKGMRIGLICNTGRTPGFSLRRFLKKEGVAEYFDMMLFSDEVGIRKPDPRIFKIAAKKLGVTSHAIIHVGDNLKSDVWGAKCAGFTAVYLSTEKGRDQIAESDPTSLVAISRDLGTLKAQDIVPNKIITSLSMIEEMIDKLE